MKKTVLILAAAAAFSLPAQAIDISKHMEHACELVQEIAGNISLQRDNKKGGRKERKAVLDDIAWQAGAADEMFAALAAYRGNYKDSTIAYQVLYDITVEVYKRKPLDVGPAIDARQSNRLKASSRCIREARAFILGG